MPTVVRRRYWRHQIEGKAALADATYKRWFVIAADDVTNGDLKKRYQAPAPPLIPLERPRCHTSFSRRLQMRQPHRPPVPFPTLGFPRRLRNRVVAESRDDGRQLPELWRGHRVLPVADAALSPQSVRRLRAAAAAVPADAFELAEGEKRPGLPMACRERKKRPGLGKE